ncbi:MAG: hypothetical protein JSU74_02580, partial [Candidatus Zixiibacteriota bacterium]
MKCSLQFRALLLPFLLICPCLVAQEMPHEDINYECEACHSLKEWSGVRFDHADSVGFVLDGRHADADCRGCHTLKDFSIISTDCVSCHKDLHEGKLGANCAKCHTTDGFTVFNIEDIHAETNFPLMGRHALADCQSCHKGLPRGDLSFKTTRCVECHQQLFLEVTSPNHVAAGFSSDCDECHQMSSWRPALLADHDAFFPIFSGEHAGEWDDCNTCHINPEDYRDFSCFGCHEHNRSDTDQDHAGIPGYSYNSQDCYLCHPTGEAGDFVDHDALYSPIASGAHSGTWTSCADCHDNPADRTQFNCLACHGATTTDNLHQSIPGYAYVSTACFGCHPDGARIEFTLHDATYFPIYSGTHAGVWDECSICHTNPANRSVFSCLTCHEQTDTDVIHTGITAYTYESTACLTCHPTGSGGEFVEHDALFFPIYTGTHSGQWDACSDCHTDPADRSVFSCTVCHTQSETNPIHSGITSYVWESSACLTCHPTGEGGEYADHDVLYFPIYSGDHDGAWGDCTTCHTNPADRSEFTCLVCHDQGATDVIHSGMASYSYESTVCLSCHAMGEISDYLEHDGDFFPIFSGTHTGQWTECSDCHTDPADRSVISCLPFCHAPTLTNNLHDDMPSYSYETSAGLTCHPTGDVSQFLEHDAFYFPIYSGTHNGAWSDCSQCHINPDNRAEYDCLGCHDQGTIDVIHMGMVSYSYVSTVCFSCHPSGAVEDYTEHDGAFFPIYSGTHVGSWADCATCHTDPADRTVFTCLVCHNQTDMDNMHVGIAGYVYNSADCYTCHPEGTEIEFTEHEISYFPIYSGAHASVWTECATCHTVVGDRTIYDCLACHAQATADVVHMGMPEYSYVSTVCYGCHSSGMPEAYPEHEANGFFPIYSGAHDGAWAECATCHTDPADRSIYDCLVCHEQATVDPVHLGMPEYSYVSTVCYGCHPNGVPEDYLEHDANFFPIYSGTHLGRWGACATCHIDPLDKSVFSCLETCHDQTQTDNRHTNPTPVPGYVYDSYECYNCHPDGYVP